MLDRFDSESVHDEAKDARVVSIRPLRPLRAEGTTSLPAGERPFDPSAAHPRGSLTGRRFLIVTAPFGPFSVVMADVLRQRGAEVSRMLFNAGDAIYWHGPGAIRFKQGADCWPARLDELAAEFTDLVVFGEGGPYNQAVIRQYGRRWREPRPSDTESFPRVWVMENGYFRPDWITLEPDGVNASSRLPRTAQAYATPLEDPEPARRVGRVLPHHVINISVHHLIQLPGRWLYPRYRAPFTQPPWLQCAGHIRRYVGLAFRPLNACDAQTIAARGPFFLACLQREGDAQLLRYSQFADNTAFLAEVMTTFAKHAPPEVRLVVKNHPLDPGLVDLPRITHLLAVERGLAHRVDFIDGGELAKLCRASRGMVVNNSTAALSAMGFGTPVKVLGDAFFDFAGLSDQSPLSRFWTDPTAPDPELFQRFRAHVIARTQINGNYHEPAAMIPTANGLADVWAGLAGDIENEEGLGGSVEMRSKASGRARSAAPRRASGQHVGRTTL